MAQEGTGGVSGLARDGISYGQERGDLPGGPVNKQTHFNSIQGRVYLIVDKCNYVLTPAWSVRICQRALRHAVSGC
jgi:hypothetical protein